MRLLFLLTLVSFILTLWIVAFLQERNTQTTWVDPPHHPKTIALNR